MATVGHYAADGSTNVTIVGGSASGPSDAPPVSGATEVVPVAIVDGSGDQITSFGGGTQYTEGDTDTTITGTAILWEDASNTLVTVNSNKPLPISVATIPSHAVTNAGTFAVQAAQSGTWNIGTVTTITNVVHVDDNSSTLSIDDGAGSITVDGTFWQATQPVSIASAVAVTDNSGSLTVDYATTGSGNATGALRVELANNGTGVLATLGTITNVVHVDDNSSSLTVDYATTGSGTATGALRVELANNGTGTLATLSTLTTLTGGGVAHDAADSGNPVKVGARAISTMSGGTNVAAADRTDLIADLDGALISRKHVVADRVKGNASNTDGSSTQVIAAQASGVKINVTDVTISNTSSTDIYVELKDGSTVIWTFPVPQKSGVTHSFQTPLTGTAATALNFDPSAAATTIYCSVSGYISKV